MSGRAKQHKAVAWIAVAGLVCGLMVQVAAQQKQRPPAPTAPKDFSLAAPRRFSLSNGLAVTMVPFGKVPKVTISLVVSAANVHEAKDQMWLANLTSSMMPEGTATLTAATLAKELASMGGELNVSVGSDTTSLSADVLSDSGVAAVRLIADVAQHPRLPEAELARVKASLLRDLAVRKSRPQAVAEERFAELLYGDHPYGRLFPEEGSVNQYSIDQVRGFHRLNYGAARSRLYVAGVFRAEAMEAAIRKAFGEWQRGTAATRPSVPPESGRRFALVDRADAPQSTVLLGLRVPSPAQSDWVAIEVTDALLGGAMISRITSNIREQKGYTYSPYSFLQSYPGQAHWVQVADVTTNVTGASLKEIFHEIERLREEVPPAAEVRGIQSALAGLFVVQNASRAGVISRLAFVDLHGLGSDYLTTYIRRVMAVAPEDIRRVARKYLTPDKMSLVVVGDVKMAKEQLAPWAGR